MFYLKNISFTISIIYFHDVLVNFYRLFEIDADSFNYLVIHDPKSGKHCMKLQHILLLLLTALFCTFLVHFYLVTLNTYIVFTNHVFVLFAQIFLIIFLICSTLFIACFFTILTLHLIFIYCSLYSFL